jgi:large subunit ribosomal protein L10
MNRDQKSAVIEEIAAQIEGADAVFAVDYRGISVPEAADLRARLRDANATFRVVKNSLTERAADRAGAETLKQLLEGPTAFTFVHGDAATAAKAISDFARVTNALAFKGGLMDGQELTAEQIGAISRLPAREVLYAQLVSTVAAPVTGLVRGLAALIGGVARQLQQIHDQGLVTGEAPAPAAEPEAEAAEAAEPEAEAAEPEAPAPEPKEPETSVDAEAPTSEEEVASPVDEAPAEAAPDEPDPEPEAEASPEPEPEPEAPAEPEAAAPDQTDSDSDESKE